MTFNIEKAKQKVETLNKVLEPIANNLVDINDPNWENILRSSPSPLDECGIRDEAETLLVSLLDAYSNGDAFQRAAIRELFSTNQAFTWATGVPEPATTKQGFRQHLLLISAVDQARDLRDTIVTLNLICAEAQASGIDTGPVLSEVAELSSDAYTSKMGSLRSTLHHAR